MSATVTLNITRDTATPAIRRMIDTCQPARLARICGPPLVDLTQKHLGAYKNRKGWPSTGFGEQAADKTVFTPDKDGLVIIIQAQGARQLYHGGTIRPVTAKRLCFGITEESYGKHPSDFGWRPGVKDSAVSKRLKGLFAYATEVTQPPHPDFIPSPEKMGEVAVEAIGDALRGGAIS